MDSIAKVLLNNDDNYSKSNSEKSISYIGESESNIVAICQSLLTSPSYDYDDTISLIICYINGNNHFKRFLYSQISTFIFGLSDEEADTFTHNLLNFFEEAIGKLDSNDPLLNIVFKFYDHAELALRQKNLLSSNAIMLEHDIIKEELTNIKDDFKTSKDKLSNAEQDFNDTIKNTQRDYITIFGIFSAIIISFVGGISFSSSVLENISIISIYRLIAIVCLLSFVLFNTIYYLISVILKVSKITIDKSIGIKRFLSIPTFFNFLIILIFIIDCAIYFIK